MPLPGPFQIRRKENRTEFPGVSKKGVDKPHNIGYNNPVAGRLAQLVEHALDVRRVSGSSPLSSTRNKSTILSAVFIKQ